MKALRARLTILVVLIAMVGSVLVALPQVAVAVAPPVGTTTRTAGSVFGRNYVVKYITIFIPAGQKVQAQAWGKTAGVGCLADGAQGVMHHNLKLRGRWITPWDNIDNSTIFPSGSIYGVPPNQAQGTRELLAPVQDLWTNDTGADGSFEFAAYPWIPWGWLPLGCGTQDWRVDYRVTQATGGPVPSPNQCGQLLGLDRDDALNGRNATYGMAADPVNTCSGNLVHRASDISTPVYGMRLDRTYNSKDQYTSRVQPETVASQPPGMFGQGWASTYDVAMEPGSFWDNPADPLNDYPSYNAPLNFRMADGRRLKFPANPLPTPSSPPSSTNLPSWQAPAQLATAVVSVTWDPSVHQFHLLFVSGELWTFDRYGQLLTQTSQFGEKIRVCRSTNAAVVSSVRAGDDTVADCATKHGLSEITFTDSNGDGLIDQVTAPDGTMMDYKYSQGLLQASSYHRTSGATWSPVIQAEAGTGTAGTTGDGGQALTATLNKPASMAYDADGNLLIADPDGNKIRRVHRDGTIDSLIGDGTAGSGDNHAAANQLYKPVGVATDGSGNSYVADWYNHRVLKIDSSGVETLFAGNGVAGISADGGQATASMLSGPTGLAVDSSGNVFIADYSSNRVLKVDTSGVMTRIAGAASGAGGYYPSQDGRAATDATLTGPAYLVLQGTDLYVSENDPSASVIRKVTAAGTISTYAGGGSSGLGDGGSATAAQLSVPRDIKFDSAGNLFIADFGDHRIRMVHSGTISTVAGTGGSGTSGEGGIATSAEISPDGLAVGGSGLVYAADYLNHRVISFTVTVSGSTASIGNVTRIAGTSHAGYDGDGGAATSANLYAPRGLALTSSGALLVAEEGNHTVRSLPNPTSSTGTITTFAGTGEYGTATDAAHARLNQPSALVVVDNVVYIADKGNHVIRMLNLGFSRNYLTIIAGVDGQAGYSGDGDQQATNGKFNSPEGITYNPGDKFFYVADSGNNRIRQLGVHSDGTFYSNRFAGPDPTVTTTAGFADGSGDAIRFDWPTGVAVAQTSTGSRLIIADTNNHRIRSYGGGNPIVTIAGTGTAGATGDGSSATAATVNAPRGVFADNASPPNIYVADTGSNKIRELTIGGNIATVAGNGTNGTNGDDGKPLAAMLSAPRGVVLDATGTLHIADTGNSRVRAITTLPGESYRYTDFDPHMTAILKTTGVGQKSVRTLSASYDGDGRVLTQDLISGDHVTFSYHADLPGYPTDVTWCGNWTGSACTSGSETTRYTHDGYGRQIQLTDTNGQATTRTYYSLTSGSTTTNRDLVAGGTARPESVGTAATAAEYDSQGRVVAAAQPDPTSGFVPPPSTGSTACKRSPVSGMTFEQFPAPGTGSCTGASGGYTVTAFEYCTAESGAPDRRVTKMTDGLGNITRYYYSTATTAGTDSAPCPASLTQQSTPTQVKDALGQITAIETAHSGVGADLGLTTKVTDPTGVIHATYWDTTRRLQLAAGTITMISGTPTPGDLSYSGYDTMGRQIATRDPAGIESWTRYDASGNVIDQIGPVAVASRTCTATAGCDFTTNTYPDGPTVHHTYRLDSAPLSARQQANAADTSSPRVTDTATDWVNGYGTPCDPPQTGCFQRDQVTDPPHGYSTSAPTATARTIHTSLHNAAGEVVSQTTADDTAGTGSAASTSITTIGVLGRVTATTSAEGSASFSLYDAQGRVCSTATRAFTNSNCTTPSVASGGIVLGTTSYDLRGRKVEVHGPAVTDESAATVQGCIHNTYDTLDRVVQTDVGAASSSGGCVTAGSTKLVQTRTYFDGAGRQAYSVVHDGTLTATTTDPNPAVITDPTTCGASTPTVHTADHVTQTVYDNAGRVRHQYGEPYDMVTYNWCTHVGTRANTSGTTTVAPSDTETVYDYAYSSAPAAFGQTIAGRTAYVIPPQTGFPYGGTPVAPSKAKYDSAGRPVENQRVTIGSSPSADTVLRSARTYYDSLGRTVATSSPSASKPVTPFTTEEAVTVSCFDAYGQKAYDSDPHAFVTGTFTATSACNGSTNLGADASSYRQYRTYDYYPNGSLRDVWSALRKSLGASSDEAKTTYFYDTRGNRTARVAQTLNDANAASTYHSITESWTYDRDNRVTGYTDPTNHASGYSYYSGSDNGALPGKLKTVTATTGRTSTATYRADGQLTQTVAHDPTTGLVFDVTEAFAYNAAGQRTKFSDTVSSTTNTSTLTYDAFGRMTGQTVPNFIDAATTPTSSYSWKYDTLGNNTDLIHPDGAHFTISHDPMNRLVTAGTYIGTTCCFVLATYNFTALGFQLNQNFISGSSSNYRNWAYRSTNTEQPYGYAENIVDGSNNITRNTTMDYNADGRMKCETPVAVSSQHCDSANSGTVNYTYDDAGQLTAATPVSVTGSGISRYTYTYNTRGMRLGQVEEAKTGTSTTATATTYNTYNDNAQLCSTGTATTDTCTSHSGATTTYTYDADGRQTTDTTGTGTSQVINTNTYDPRGLLVTTATTTGGTASNTEQRFYNATHRLVHRTNGLTDGTKDSKTSDFIWDENPADGITQILDGSTNTTTTTKARFNYAIGRINFNANGTGYAYAYDVHGNNIATSATSAPDRYDPYGKPSGNPGVAPYAYFGYRGELTINGTVYLRARNYQPATGTFSQRDPLPGSPATTVETNPYHYADNDPANRSDPSGMRPGDRLYDDSGPSTTDDLYSEHSGLPSDRPITPWDSGANDDCSTSHSVAVRSDGGIVIGPTRGHLTSWRGWMHAKLQGRGSTSWDEEDAFRFCFYTSNVRGRDRIVHIDLMVRQTQLGCGDGGTCYQNYSYTNWGGHVDDVGGRTVSGASFFTQPVVPLATADSPKNYRSKYLRFAIYDGADEGGRVSVKAWAYQGNYGFANKDPYILAPDEGNTHANGAPRDGYDGAWLHANGQSESIGGTCDPYEADVTQGENNPDSPVSKDDRRLKC